MASGDLILMPQPGTWALDSGLVASGDTCSLDRFEELFQDYIIPATIGAVVSGGGTVLPIPSLYAYTMAAADVAMWYVKEAINIATVESYVYRLNVGNVNISSPSQPFMVKQGVAAPDIDGDIPVIAIDARGNGKWRLSYRDNAGNVYTWNDVTNAWVLAFRDLATVIDFNHAFEVRLNKTATSWSLIFKDLTTDTVIVDTSAAPITWAATYNAGGLNKYFFGGGDYATVASLTETRAVSIWKNYPLSSQMATMGQIAFNGIFKQFPITQIGDVGWQYNKDGAGWVQPGAGTPAEIETALDGLYITTLDFRAPLASDALGDDPASFDINGGAIGTEGTPLTASYELPQSVIIEDEEIIIIEGCD